MSAYDLPTLNATLNATAGVLLLFGWRAIRRRDVRIHQRFMLAALAASAAFLSSYAIYHLFIHGVTHYRGGHWDRIIYFVVLGTHTPLATLMVPFILAAVWFAYRGQFERHVRITRWLWPVWMYVSVTGVIIYIMLYVFPGGGLHGAVGTVRAGL